MRLLVLQLLRRAIWFCAVVVCTLMRPGHAEPSCNLEQLESCRSSVSDGRVTSTSGGGRCFIRAYDRYTHVCDVAHHWPNTGHCCCEITEHVALCCRYRQHSQMFRCDQREDLVHVSYARNSYLFAILIPVSLITLTAVVSVIACRCCCCRQQNKQSGEPEVTCCSWQSNDAENHLPAHLSGSSNVTSSTSVCLRSFLARFRSSGSPEQCVKQLHPPRMTSQSYLEPSAPSPPSHLDANVSSTCLHCSRYPHSTLSPPSYEESHRHAMVRSGDRSGSPFIDLPPLPPPEAVAITVADVERTCDVINDPVQHDLINQ